jgi:hypothetical protein
MPLEAERRPELVAFSRMVVHHIQQHFDTCIVQAFDHGFEFRLNRHRSDNEVPARKKHSVL